MPVTDRTASPPSDHDGLDPRLLGADLLDRPRADHGLLLELQCVLAGGRGETVSIFGVIEVELSHAERPEPPAAARAEPALFKLALMTPACAGTRETMLSDTVKFAEAPRACPNGPCCVDMCSGLICDPARHRLRPRIRFDARLRRGHRDDLLLARHRQADHRLHPVARPGSVMAAYLHAVAFASSPSISLLVDLGLCRARSAAEEGGGTEHRRFSRCSLLG